MSLPTERTEQHFVLKEDGKIYWIEMPPTPDFSLEDYKKGSHLEALQSAISNAVEVSNFDETEDAILDAHATGHGFRLDIGKVYSLQCSVEKRETPDNRDGKIVALVTFSQPEREETQEEEIQWQIFREMYLMCVDENGIDLELATKYFTINRKP